MEDNRIPIESFIDLNRCILDKMIWGIRYPTAMEAYEQERVRSLTEVLTNRAKPFDFQGHGGIK